MVVHFLYSRATLLSALIKELVSGLIILAPQFGMVAAEVSQLWGP